jgi:hypothetical protein
MTSVLVIVFNLLTDLLYLVVDPRVEATGFTQVRIDSPEFWTVIL